VGYTPFTRRSGRSVLDQALEACRNAVDDAGIETAQVDGIASFMLMHDSVPAVAVASGLALPGLRYVLDAQLGGQAPCYLVGEAATAVNAGHAEYVLVFRALNGRSGPRVGTMPFAGAGGQYRYPIGYDAYLMYVAMWARRFLLETAQGEEDLAAVARRTARRFEISSCGTDTSKTLGGGTTCWPCTPTTSNGCSRGHSSNGSRARPRSESASSGP
jgi:acetyl-CoA acetyltransferase